MTHPDRTGLRDAVMGELLAAFKADTAADAHEVLSSLLIRRCTDLIRSGARETLAAESELLLTFVDGPEAQAVAERHPAHVQAWRAYGELLDDAAARRDVAAIPSLLLDREKPSGRALELLLQAPNNVLPRRKLRAGLGCSESSLGHLLQDMEEASLIERVRQPGVKEVQIVFGVEGRAWAAGRVAQPARGEVSDLPPQFPSLRAQAMPVVTRDL